MMIKSKCKPWNWTWLACIGIILSSGCASIKRERDILPQEYVNTAEIPGIPRARWWGDLPNTKSYEEVNLSEQELREKYAGILGKPHYLLGLSGGGANGAYGAGMLTGWTAKGDRPEFTMVTGISTGGIMAPWAFLGSDYDDVLIQLYTLSSTKDVISKRGLLKGIRSDALADSTPLQELILSLVTDEVIDKISVEHRKGRRLFIGTVNMDSLRPVTWDIGAIADSGQPGSRELIAKIIVASASIPIAFPPVFIDVEANGEIYQEMHVDGGLASQIFVYSSHVKWSKVEKRLGHKDPTTVLVIRNAKIDPEWVPVEAKVIALAGRSLSSLIRTQGIGDLEEIILAAERDGLGFEMAYIPGDFNEKATEGFDPVYMKKLFDLGYQNVLDGKAWKNKFQINSDHQNVKSAIK